MDWSETVEGLDARKALHVPLGVASPLWFAFGAATSAGLAYWWMTRWTRFTNIEAVFAAGEPLTKVMEAAPAEAVNLVAQEAGIAGDVALAALEAVEEPVAETVEAESAAVEAAPALPEPSLAAAADDLTRLVGVGPKLAAALAERGVSRFADIAAWTEADLAEIDKALDLKGRAVRDAWVAQARRFAEAV